MDATRRPMRTLMAPARCMVMQLSGLRESSCRERAVARCTSAAASPGPLLLLLVARRKPTIAAMTPSLPNDLRLSPYQQQTEIASATW